MIFIQIGKVHGRDEEWYREHLLAGHLVMDIYMCVCVRGPKIVWSKRPCDLYMIDAAFDG